MFICCVNLRQVAMKTLRYETGFHKKPLWLWPINVNMRLLKAVGFVVDVVVAAVIVNFVVLALLVVTSHIIFSCGQ